MEITFRAIFESIPISVWVEDFSAVLSALDKLRNQGVVDLRSYLRDKPGEIERLVQLIRVLDINQASLGLYGASSKEELFESLDMLFTPQALAAFREELVAVAEDRPGYTAEVESRKLGGERLDLLISVVPASPGGGWRRALVTATDITERKRTEAQLAQSREQYKDLVEKAGIAIGMDREDGSLRYINDQGVEMFGYSQQELRSLSHKDLVHPDDYQRVSKIHEARLAGKDVPSRYEFRVLRSDGSAIWIEVEAASVEEDGRVVGTRSYMWDISGRKQLEAELRESRTSFAAIVDQNTDGITVVDAGGVVRFANPAACALLETPLDQLVGSRSDWAADVNGGDELEVRRSNGAPGVAELGSIETTWDGQPARLVVLHDVTERKRLEKELLQAQKMEAIGRLAGGVAHEFNNLLQAMLSTAEARLAGDAGGAGTELLRELEPLIQRGRSQTRQLLLFSRREEPQLEPLELNRGAAREHRDAGASGRREHPSGAATGRSGSAGSGRPGSTRPGSRQPGGQRCRCSAGGGNDHSSQWHSARGRLRLGTGSTRAGEYSAGGAGAGLVRGRGQRHRYPRTRPRPHVRAVLHHQGAGPRYRARAVGGARYRQPSPRQHRGRQPRESRHPGAGAASRRAV